VIFFMPLAIFAATGPERATHPNRENPLPKTPWKSVLFAACLLSAAGLASAQETPPRPRFGVGISQGTVLHAAPYGTYQDMENLIYVSVNETASRLKFEPEFGYWRQKQEDGDADLIATQLRVGLGVFIRKVHGATDTYFGGRAGLERQGVTLEVDGDEESETRSSLYGGPVAGAEHFLSPSFSLGAEAQLIFSSHGSADDAYDEAPDVSSWDTRGHIFLRWYP
jgi:hypothetical protein